MKQTFSSHRSIALSSVLLIIMATTVGCKDPAEPLSSLRHANVRSELKDNFKSAFSNLAREAKNSGSLKGVVDNIQRLLQIDLGGSGGLPNMEVFDPEFLGTVFDKFLDSELAKSLFAETNIASRTDSEVVYIVDRGVCAQLAGLMGSKSADEQAITMCNKYLEKNALELHVKSQNEKEFELEIWHGVIATNVAAKKFVLSLAVLPNSIGTRLNLDGVKDFSKGFFDLLPKEKFTIESLNVINLPLDELKTMKGTLSLSARFKSDKAASGCVNNERLCFVVNADEDIQIELAGEEQLQFSFGHSTKENPTLTVAPTSDNGFTGSFNLGALEGQSAAGRLFVEASQFKVTLPEISPDAGLKLTVENFKPGSRASTFVGGGKNITVDLKNASRTIEFLQFSMQANKIQLTMSPLALLLSFSDDSDETCKSYESVEFTNHSRENTTVQFLSATDSPSTFASHPSRRSTTNRHFFYRSNDTDVPACTADNLMIRRVLMSMNVSTQGCNEPGMVAVTQGSLGLVYKYHVNKEDEKDIFVSVQTGQCLAP